MAVKKSHTAVMEDDPEVTPESDLPFAPDLKPPDPGLPGSPDLKPPDLKLRDLVEPFAGPPTSLNQLLDPDAVNGTHFTGPVMSGPKGQASGICTLHKRARITFQKGTSWSVPVKLPASAILLRAYLALDQLFDGAAPTLKIEQTTGGSAYATFDLKTGPIGLMTATITGLLTSSWTFYVTMSCPAATVGKCTLMVEYSVPANVFPN